MDEWTRSSRNETFPFRPSHCVYAWREVNAIRAYRRRFPGVTLRLAELDTTQQIEALASSAIDLGLNGLGLPREAGDLELALVAEETLVAVLPQDHPLAHAEDGVRFIPRDAPAPVYRYYAAWRAGNLRAALHQFVEMAREHGLGYTPVPAGRALEA